MGGGAKLFELLGGEDVDGDQVNLGVTVLAGLGGGHLQHLARLVLDKDHVALLDVARAGRVGVRAVGVLLEFVLG